MYVSVSCLLNELNLFVYNKLQGVKNKDKHTSENMEQDRNIYTYAYIYRFVIYTSRY